MIPPSLVTCLYRETFPSFYIISCVIFHNWSSFSPSYLPISLFKLMGIMGMSFFSVLTISFTWYCLGELHLYGSFFLFHYSSVMELLRNRNPRLILGMTLFLIMIGKEEWWMLASCKFNWGFLLLHWPDWKYRGFHFSGFRNMLKVFLSIIRVKLEVLGLNNQEAHDFHGVINVLSWLNTCLLLKVYNGIWHSQK